MAYAELEPFGAWREDIRTAHQTAHLLTTMIAVAGGRASVAPSDVLLRFTDEQAAPTLTLSDKLKRWAAMLGATDLREETAP